MAQTINSWTTKQENIKEKMISEDRKHGKRDNKIVSCLRV